MARKPARRIKPSQLRSQAWFDNPANIDMTALYIERTMNFGLSRDELQSGGFHWYPLLSQGAVSGWCLPLLSIGKPTSIFSWPLQSHVPTSRPSRNFHA